RNGDRHQPTSQQSSHRNHSHNNDRHGSDRRSGGDNHRNNNNYSGNNKLNFKSIQFVEGFSSLALPLTKLMRKGEKFVWDEEREKSFEELKQRFVSAPVLTLPSGSGRFQIYSDASKKGLG
nr:putative reverse transcriptase domain-containing protein [Tanacetum cinerariifolium]